MHEGSARRAGRGAPVLRVALTIVAAAPVALLLLLLPATGASAANGGDGYAPPTVRTVAVPSPAPSPAPTVTATRQAPAAPAPTPATTAAPAAVVVTATVPPPAASPPTILRNALPTFRDLIDHPERIAVGAATAALWFLLVALPGSLLDSAIEKRSHGRMGRALAVVATTLNRAIDQVSQRSRWRLAGPLLVALIAGTAFGFADPHLAWDERSLSTIASLLVALTMITVVASQVGALLARTWWGIDAELRAEPLGLLAAVAGVAVGRFLSLSPGLFLGLVVGVDAGEGADQPRRSKAVVARHMVVFTFAIGAWVAYSLLFGARHGEAATDGAAGPGPVAGFVSDVLSAMTLEGLTYLITSLLPLPLLPGREVFLHSKRLWGGLYATFAIAFTVLALPSILGEQEREAGTLVRQGAVMVAFAAVSILSWVRSRSRGQGAEVPQNA